MGLSEALLLKLPEDAALRFRLEALKALGAGGLDNEL